MSISVTVLTKNSERHLRDVLGALQYFNEVVVYDTGSTDQTLSIARAYPNVKLTEGSFIGFGPTHNNASACATHDWILSIDSDEVVSSDLANEVLSLSLDPSSVYSVWRKNFFNGKWIRWCGWYPDRVYRLYNRKKTAYNDKQVHESVIVNGLKIVPLKHPLIHYPYEKNSDFTQKLERYTDLFAQENRGKKRSSLLKAISHGSYAFFKSYILQRGILGGKEGWIISLYNARCSYYKYVKLLKLNKQMSILLKK